MSLSVINKLEEIMEKKFSKWYKKMSVGTKLALSTVLVSSAVFGAYIGSMSYYTKSLAINNSVEELVHTTDSVMLLISTFDNNISHQANRFNELLTKKFTGAYSLDAVNTMQAKNTSVPILKDGDTVLNNNNEELDTFKNQTGLTSTIFVKTGNDFVRVATTLTNEKNERIVGEKMDHGHPGYASLIEGKPYAGVAEINGKFYGTSYKPLRDDKNNVVGVIYVGIDISAEMAKLKESIKSIKVGDTGYYYILGSNPESKKYGELLLHPVKEGTNLLNAKDANGKLFIQEMLKKKNGVISYPWLNTERNETVAQDKTVVYRTYENWNWTVGGGTYNYEIAGEIDKVYNVFAGILVFVMVALAAGLYIVIRKTIVEPLKQVQSSAQALAKGDLTMQLSTHRQDEIGALYHAMNDIAVGLEKVVSNVQVGAINIKVASQEIAAGNNDLSSRTEDQAASLEETASSMEEMTSTIKNNSEQARQVSEIVVQTSKKAEHGGAAMHDLVHNMEAIKNSSQKIVDIISVIDGIAFQTNILALNAAVEAAHAGEQGRGFAVVASEVRSLAQRSAQAAKEIKQLIDDSMEKVHAGNVMVNSTSSTIEDIVHSVKNVESIMKEIAQANHEQTLGIEQINSAISQMDNVTQQNAALVEEAAAAATSMLEQAQQMEDSVLVFKLKK